MLLKNLVCVVALPFALLALNWDSASADDKADKGAKSALSGVWMQKSGEMKIEFADKDGMKLFPHGENKVIIIVCRYTAATKGLVKAKITGLEGEARDQVKEILPLGLEFRFKWTVKDDTGTLEEIKGENVDALKAHLEGKYGRKKEG
jgi:hypothetical protein